MPGHLLLKSRIFSPPMHAFRAALMRDRAISEESLFGIAAH
jgi:hypothetical protein